MLGFQKLGSLQLLHHPAGIHHGDAIAKMRHERQVVADEDEAHAAFRYQLLDQPQDFRLHRGVKRAGRFVGNQQFRIGREHHGDHHALAHAAGNLMGIGRGDLARIADFYLIEQGDGRFHGGSLAAALVGAPGFGHLRADGLYRVQRIFRVLQDEARPLAADLAHLPFAGGQHVDAVEGELVGADIGIGGEKLH